MRWALPCTLVLCGAAACASLKVQQPATGWTVPTPVTVQVNAGADIQPSSVVARLDGADVSHQFTVTNGLRGLSASLPMANGQHTLEVSAGLWNGLYQRYDTSADKVTFTAAPGGSFTLALDHPALAISPGASGTLGLNVTRAGAFTGDVNVSAAWFATGTGSPPRTTIPASATSGTLTIPVAAGVVAREEAATVYAAGAIYSTLTGGNQPFTVRVAHPTGAFQLGGVVAFKPYDSATGPDGSTQVDIDNGTGGSQYVARFVRGTAQLGSVVGFDPGPTVGNQSFGGAGFCPAPGVGFVISGTGTGAGAGYALTFRFFEDVGYNVVIDVNAFQTPLSPFVEPTVWFGPGCGILIVIGADDASSARKHQAQVYDFFRVKPICKVSFDEAPTQIQASVLAPVAENQQVSITADGQTRTCDVF